MKLTDVDALNRRLTTLYRLARSDAQSALLGRVFYILNTALTIDAEPVRHGRWISHPTEPLWDVCSACGTGCKRRENDDGAEIQHCYQYCPWCGARMMDGDGE